MMKIKLHKIFFVIGILTILNSCTIEKRLHQKGFHVEWRNNLKSDKAKSEVPKAFGIKVVETDNFDLATTTNDSLKFNEDDPQKNEITEFSSKTVEKKEIYDEIILEDKKVNVEKENQSIKQEKKSKSELKNEVENKKFNLETLLSLGFTILSFISFAIVINALKYYLFANALIISFVIFFLFSVLALIFSIRALKKISKNKNKGFLFASISLIYGIGATLLALLISLMVIALAYS